MTVTHVISARIDGMGGRLGAVVNGMRLARKLGADYSVLWVPHIAAANITDPGFIFNIPQMQALGVHFLNMTHFLGQPQRGGAVWFDAYTPQINEEALAVSTWVISSSHISALPGEKRSAIREGLAEATSALLHFSPEICEGIARHPAAEELENMVGVHVRRGDIVDNANPIHRNRVVPEEMYFKVLDSAFPDRDIFLCTETEEVVSAFRNRYGRRLVTPETTGWGRTSPELTRQAVIEMALLARCSAILGSQSAFSRTAAYLHNRPFLSLSRDCDFATLGRELRERGQSDRATLIAAMAQGPESNVAG